MEYDQTNQKIKKLAVLIIIGVLLIGLSIFLFSLFNKSKLVITTQEGAEIFVSESQDDVFESIGSTEATYTTTYEGDVYIKVVMDEKETQTSASIKKRQTTEKNVELRDTVSYTAIGEGPLAYLYKDKDFIFGINPSTKSITAKPLLGVGSIPQNSFADLPFARKVTWTDKNNFIFNTFGDGVIKILNGKKFIIGSTAEDSQTPVIDFASHPGKSRLYLATDGIYREKRLTDPAQPEIENIAYVIPQGSIYFGSDEERIYLATQEFNEDELQEGDFVEPTESKVLVYNYSGDLINEFNIQAEDDVYKIEYLESQNNYAVLTNSALWLLDPVSENTFKAPYYFENTKDLLVIDDEVLVLNPGGLWQYSFSESSYYKLSSFKEGEEYVDNSLTKIGNEILFSSKISASSLSDPNSSANSYIYKVNLTQD